MKILEYQLFSADLQKDEKQEEVKKAKKEKVDSSDDSSSDDDDGELHPLLQAHRRPVTKPQPKPKELLPRPKNVVNITEETKPAAKPEEVAKLYLSSMKYRSNPEPVLETLTSHPPVSREGEVQHQMHPNYHHEQQHFDQHQAFGSFPHNMQQSPPPPPPANVFSQDPVDYHHNVPFNRPPKRTLQQPHKMMQPPQRMIQPPVGDNFRMHPQARPPPPPLMFDANHGPTQQISAPPSRSGYPPFHRPPIRNMMAPIRGF